MDLLSSLNPEQQQAVLQTQGPLLILAGAGSGKTRVIAHRIAHIVSSGIAAPDRFLAVTFTNKAAEEMRTRVESLLGVDCRQMWISTFHALCARLLRREAPHVGLSRDFVIYDSTDQLAVIKQALKQFGVDDNALQPRLALSRISHAKNRMEGPEVFTANSWNPRDHQIGKLYAAYVQALKDANALDFDDLLLRTVELFETSELVRDRYSEKFRYLMVDEYQDTNRPQYLMIHRLAARHRNLCVVGDPDQSIYKWRGADLRNILDFEHDFPEVATVRLERNYRSTQVILDAASAVIAQNRNRKEKRLYTDRRGGAKILYYRAGDDLDEAEFIARTARTALQDDPENTVAILYRTNAQSRTLEDALRRSGTPYKIIGGVRFYERKEIKDSLAYLKLVLNPHDDVSLRRVINVPARGIGKGVMESLEAVELSSEADLPPLLAGLQPSRRTTHSGQGWSMPSTSVCWRRAPRPHWRHFAICSCRPRRSRARTPCRSRSARCSIRAAICRIFATSAARRPRAASRTSRSWCRRHGNTRPRTPEPSLGGFVDQLSLLSDVDEEAGSRDARVLMMTMHSAKGLEFPVVVHRRPRGRPVPAFAVRRR